FEDLERAFEPQPLEELALPAGIPAPIPQPIPSPTPAAKPEAEPEPPAADGHQTVPLRGIASRIVENMESSLTVPTATSVRNIPVKALEENRRIINHHQMLIGQAKVSFTHVIAFAIVKAITEFPRMNSSFEMQDGQPVRVDHDDVNLGIAIDIEKKDGSRSLLVPNIKGAQKLNFSEFLRAYNDVIRRARSGSLEVSDFQGTTISLTNPGTIGTVSSIPRLMPRQGTIVATGQIDYPAEYSATDPEVLAELGVSKVMTMTSTYDHRIIQGAESGAFLARIHMLLLGSENFYDEIFTDLKVPFAPVHWSRDENRAFFDRSARGEAVARQAGVLRMINAYRVRGHLIADLDPLEYKLVHHPELNPIFYGFTLWDLDRQFICGGLCGRQTARLRDILDTLRETYCGKLGPEYMHIQDPIQKNWLQDRMEPTRNASPLPDELKRRILKNLNDSEAFERFLHTKYVGHKRFSLEGSESLIPMVDHLLNIAADDGVEEVVFGMAHRGRLNVLATIMSKSYERIFSEFEGDLDPSTTQGSGDVKYHLGAEGLHDAPSGKKLKLTLASNPSHLEAVGPVAEGMARAKQKLINDFKRLRVVPVLIHGDAAFAGQGVVAESLNLSQLKGYRTGGTVHIVVNNQIGFTTGPESARSSVYATDVAKMVQAPIFHVNGDDPEACIRAIQLAFEFRQEFRKDVVIDMFCYRRHGHNEADDPSMTQPRMYKLIKEHRSVRKLYTEALLRKEDLDPEEAEQWLEDFQKQLQVAFDKTQEHEAPEDSRSPLYSDEAETGFQNLPSVDTGLTPDKLQRVGAALVTLPDGFTLHPRLRSFLEKRRKMIAAEEQVDWAMAETMAFGSLLAEGFRLRLSGQDSARGTFSQRHSILHDYQTAKPWIPLNLLARNPKWFGDMWRPKPGEFDHILEKTPEGAGQPGVNVAIYDSLLSEYAVLGFEYGYSIVDKNALVMWEAQFGDFSNGAQIIIDQFIASAEEKWNQHSGLVLLLPHGYEGQGPEHSSARLERFLTLCAEGNMQVVYPTSAAQYFHLLRRQMRLQPRKPLIVMTPKFLLRYPPATSPLKMLQEGRFEPVLDDPVFDAGDGDAGAVSRIILTSGKIYYDLSNQRTESKRGNVAIVRLEQFYPWPQTLIEAAFHRYPNATEVVWVQEEPRNMGGWDFVDERLVPILGGKPLRYVGRPPSASPATGLHSRHEAQQREIVRVALAE
ncbi:MAG TPA: multifunctional oxoglutarate decarboxylase/oxoglutarate dehydrogenase thiamine pyrophosphate-binding subunit/dihydrolipoyllysine-residue succinyltransferase subunit, partial [Thermoanaerobaculia bacterium]|nr:multifunctional oxoglutarate decarboxylase/oxoglutarate dehydrogenase thiamine pyrophosphate-binding subunit/dihydrolipoyllysine-residue succinyltransferase subunit [Thermoanaerobaculia bacterium]